MPEIEIRQVVPADIEDLSLLSMATTAHMSGR